LNLKIRRPAARPVSVCAPAPASADGQMWLQLFAVHLFVIRLLGSHWEKVIKQSRKLTKYF